MEDVLSEAVKVLGTEWAAINAAHFRGALKRPIILLLDLGRPDRYAHAGVHPEFTDGIIKLTTKISISPAIVELCQNKDRYFFARKALLHEANHQFMAEFCIDGDAHGATFAGICNKLSRERGEAREVVSHEKYLRNKKYFSCAFWPFGFMAPDDKRELEAIWGKYCTALKRKCRMEYNHKNWSVFNSLVLLEQFLYDSQASAPEYAIASFSDIKTDLLRRMYNDFIAEFQNQFPETASASGSLPCPERAGCSPAHAVSY